MTLYHVSLFIHSLLRWVVLFVLLAVLVRAVQGWMTARAWHATDRHLGRFLVASLNVQILLGIALYVFLTTFRPALFADFAVGVKEPQQRFFGMEHPLAMLVAVGIVHSGFARARRAASDAARFRRLSLTLSLALVVMLIAIPWPGLRHGRPLARGLLAPALEAAPAVAASCPPVFESRCSPCHGPNGRGDGPAGVSLVPPPRDFSSQNFLAQRSDEELAAVIREGGLLQGKSGAMPPHADLSAEAIRQLVDCVRSFAPEERAASGGVR